MSATIPKKRLPNTPAAGTAYPFAVLPAAPVADAEALLAADEAEDAMLLAELEADVKKEDAAEVALFTRLFSAELALARRLLISLERLLCAEGPAVAATDERLETLEDAAAEMEEASDSTTETSDWTSVGILLARDDASDAAEVTAEPATDVALPAAEVASLATEVAIEMIELMAELRSD
ncbi:uncharacterized protein A1O5_11909 [Cladophialophora psammophila CBS 110553]|uniref:Uncharacterized protein n=1 Tax=Cladophialophora psammophila CBS 110553 TaxID=1182543 RepID=W9WA17_9EURO|nr:uncharacterized protein A1O5_11909 [Cladophialophora psammophila CBS 110553]EXJ61351.1 hypothetical protein A1O5_11909 [Cladophialophora psammophila CBS 110553]